MSSTRVTLALLACLIPSAVWADDGPRLDEDDLARAFADRLAAAVGKKDWPAAAGYVQKLLDAGDDIFIQVKRQGGGKDVTIWTSPHAEGEYRLSTSPLELREAYEKKHEIAATTLFAAAKKENDPDKVAAVTHRFRFTAAGTDALLWLANHHLDRKRPALAAMTFDRLLLRVPLEQLGSEDLYRAAGAFRRAGAESTATRAWKVLAGRAKAGVLTIGDRKQTVKEWQDELEQTAPLPSAPGWAMYRGDAARSDAGQGEGLPANRQWGIVTIGDTQRSTGAELLNGAVNQQRKLGRPVLPGSFPLAVGGLVIYHDSIGLRAVDRQSGKVAWSHSDPLSLESLFTPQSHLVTPATDSAREWQKAEQHETLYDNSLVGTLSTDGKYVYTVSDLQLPLLPKTAPRGDVVNLNRLQAHDLTTGKFRWEVGGRSTVDEHGPLEDAFFRGPPLPLGGLLHVLTEKKGLLQYAALEPRVGEVVRVRKLGTIKGDLTTEPRRRARAVHLASADGVLVCPTDAGAVYGIDPFTGDVLWGHLYRTAATGWRATAPAVGSGKVVLAPADSEMLSCLDLRDGHLLWERKREADDLSLAGVFGERVVVVGLNYVRALGLEDGKPLWQVETGIPCGQGVCAGGLYYLPLQSFVRLKLPGVCAIDLDRGKVAARRYLGEDDLPGNLILTEGAVVTQSATELISFAREARSDVGERLKKDPTDADALIERAERKLDGRDVQGAIEDLRTAAEKNPSGVVPAPVLRLAHRLLSAELERDFAASEKHLDFYRSLCRLEFGERSRLEKGAAAPEEAQRIGGLHLLLGNARLKQGKLEEALEAYRDLAMRSESPTLLELGPRQLSSERAAANGVAEVFARATPAERQKLEAVLAPWWKTTAASKNPEAWRLFLNVTGMRSALGREAALRFPENFVPELAETESILLALRCQTEDPVSAGRGLLALAEILRTHNLDADAAVLYRELGRDFAKTVVRDGKTGAEILDGVRNNRGLQRFLEPAPDTGKAAVKVKAGEESKILRFRLEPAGDWPPLLASCWPALNLTQDKLELYDARQDGWLYPTRVSIYPDQWLREQPATETRLFRCRLHGHILLANVDDQVIARDLITKRLLWQYQTFGKWDMRRSKSQARPLAHDEGLWVIDERNRSVHMGVPPLLLASTIAVQTDLGLTALDLQGNVAWRRPDVPIDCDLFGDEQHVFAVSQKVSRAFRVADGAEVAIPPFFDLWRDRTAVAGRTVLVTEVEKGARTLRLHDALTGEDLWRKRFEEGSLIAYTDDENLTAVVEPGGRVTVFDVREPRPIFTAKVDIKNPQDLHGLAVLMDRTSWYVLTNEVAGGGQPAFAGSSGMRATAVNGMVWAFDRGTGKERWSVEVKRQSLLLSEFGEIPALVFASRVQRPKAGEKKQEAVELLVLDKKNGRTVYEATKDEKSGPFHTLKRDPKTGAVQLSAEGLTLTVTRDKE